MRSSLILLVCLFSFLGTTAQEYLQSPEFTQFWNNVDHLKRLEGEAPVAYKGSPYLYESDDAGIILQNGQLLKPLTMRYNVHNDVMEIKKGDVFYNLPKEKYFPTITLGEHPFDLKVYQELNKKQVGYFEVLVSDSICSMFLKHKVFLQEAEEPKPFQDAKPAEFKLQSPELFLSVKGSVLHEFNNEKGFLELIDGHQQEVESFIKQHKIRFRKPDHVQALVEYYNSL